MDECKINKNIDHAELKTTRDIITVESLERFLKKYGHLRPGAYDITSQRYDASVNRFLSNKEKSQSVDKRRDDAKFT